MGDKMISGVTRDRPKGKNRVCVFPCHHPCPFVCFVGQNKEVKMGKIIIIQKPIKCASLRNVEPKEV